MKVRLKKIGTSISLKDTLFKFKRLGVLESTDFGNTWMNQVWGNVLGIKRILFGRKVKITIVFESNCKAIVAIMIIT